METGNSGVGNWNSGNQEPVSPKSETGILPCEIIWLVKPKLKVSQHRIALSSDISRKTANKVLKGRAPRKKSREKEKSRLTKASVNRHRSEDPFELMHQLYQHLHADTLLI